LKFFIMTLHKVCHIDNRLAPQVIRRREKPFIIINPISYNSTSG